MNRIDLILDKQKLPAPSWAKWSVAINVGLLVTCLYQNHVIGLMEQVRDEFTGKAVAQVYELADQVTVIAAAYRDGDKETGDSLAQEIPCEAVAAMIDCDTDQDCYDKTQAKAKQLGTTACEGIDYACSESGVCDE